MKLIDKTTTVPLITEATERDSEGGLAPAVLAEFGRAAVDVGSPDRGLSDDRTDAVDTVANVLHWVHRLDIDTDAVLHSAARHFYVEVETIEKRAIRILSESGIDAGLHHTGGAIWVAEARSETNEGRYVWVTDSEGDEAGPFLVGTYPDSEGQPWFESLSGPCSADDLVARVQRGLSQRPGDDQ